MAVNKFKVYAETPGTNTDATSTVQTDSEFASDNDVKLGAKKQTEVKSRPLNTALREVSLLATSLINALENIKATSAEYSPNDSLANFTNLLQTALLGIVKSNQDANFNAASITTATITTIVSALMKSQNSLAINLVDGSNTVLGTVSLGDNKLRLKYGNGYIDITNNSVTISDGSKSATIATLVDKVSANNATITIQKNGVTVDSFTVNQSADKTINFAVGKSDVGLGNLTNDKQLKGKASGTTENHFIVFGADGYTVKDAGAEKTTTVRADGSADNTHLPTEKGVRDAINAVTLYEHHVNLLVERDDGSGTPHMTIYFTFLSNVATSYAGQVQTLSDDLYKSNHNAMYAANSYSGVSNANTFYEVTAIKPRSYGDNSIHIYCNKKVLSNGTITVTQQIFYPGTGVFDVYDDVRPIKIVK